MKEAGAEGLSFELLNRNVDQPFKYVATWLIDEWSKVGLHVKQRVLPTGPWFEAMRNGDFDVVLEAPGHGMVNPLLDIQKALPATPEFPPPPSTGTFQQRGYRLMEFAVDLG